MTRFSHANRKHRCFFSPRVLSTADILFEDRGWTRGHATLSFDDVPKAAPGWLDYGLLRLAALQTIDPNGGYKMHPHAEVETITIVLDGQIAHDDTIDGKSIAGPNDVAVLSAGTGMQHEEMVHGSKPARAVLFWLRTEQLGQAPRFVKKTFDREARRNRLVTLASADAHDVDAGALHVRSTGKIMSAMLDANASVTHTIANGRRAYLLTTDAAIDVNGARAEAGDRVLVTESGDCCVRSLGSSTEVFLVNLPA